VNAFWGSVKIFFSHILKTVVNFCLSNKKPIVVILLIVISLFLYLNTMRPGMNDLGDSVKFQYVGKILGIPHSTGFPLYLLLNKAFVEIPYRSVGYRANFMSVFFSILTLVFLFLLINKLTDNIGAAFYSSLLFGFGLIYWSQSIIAEVYTLNSFFVALTLFLLIKWDSTQKTNFFYIFLFIYALGFGNHLVLITLLPAFLFFILATNHKIIYKPKTILVGLVSVIFGLGLYGYFFIRTAQKAPHIEHQVKNLYEFIHYVTGKNYQAYLFDFSIGDIVTERIPWCFDVFNKNLSIAALLVGIFGLFYLWKKQKKVFFLFCLAFLGELFFLINYNIAEIKVYFIPLFLIYSVFVAFGLVFSFTLVKRKKNVQFLFHLLILTFLIVFIGKHYQKVDKSKDVLRDKKLTQAIKKIEDDSVIVTTGYFDREFVNYKLFAEFPDRSIFHLQIAKGLNVFNQIVRNIKTFANEKSISFARLYNNIYIITGFTIKFFQEKNFRLKKIPLTQSQRYFFYGIVWD
jgi:hypothetical protein